MPRRSSIEGVPGCVLWVGGGHDDEFDWVTAVAEMLVLCPVWVGNGVREPDFGIRKMTAMAQILARYSSDINPTRFPSESVITA